MLAEILAVSLRVAILYPTVLPTILALSVLSYYDVKYREFDVKVALACIPGIVTGLAIYMANFGDFVIYTAEFVVTIATSVTMVLTTIVLSRRGLIGSGDILIASMVAIGSPYTVNIASYRVPFPVVVLALGSVYVVMEIVANAFHNASRLDRFLSVTRDCTVVEKLFYFTMSKVFTVDEFRSKRFYFPVKHVGRKRYLVQVGVEPLEGSQHAVEGSLVLATKGIPFVIVMLTGYVLASLVLAVRASC